MKYYINSIILCLFEVLVGVLLLINPLGFTSGIITSVGIITVAYGVINTVKYFRTDPVEAADNQFLVRGLIALLAGLFCVLHSEWFIVTFPILSVIYGITFLVTGLFKVQTAVDMLRLHNKKWIWGAISAALSIICATIIINNPFAVMVTLWKFIGIALIVEAILDAIVLIVRYRGNREIATE